MAHKERTAVALQQRSKPGLSEWTAWAGLLRDPTATRNRLGFRSGEECGYRGHASDVWDLTPTLFRKRTTKAATDFEWATFFEFQARARELHVAQSSDWDTFFHMRHHGLPTRLLDWTENFGVALYFAVRGVKPLSGHRPCLWLLNPYALNAFTVKTRDLWSPKYLGYSKRRDRFYDYGELLGQGIWWRRPVAIYPNQRSARMFAQRGWFTIHGTDPFSYRPTDSFRHIAFGSGFRKN